MSSARDTLPQTRSAIRVSEVLVTLGRCWYYVGITAMFFIGWSVPSVGLWMRSVGTMPYLIAFAFFLNGFALSTKSLVNTTKQWRLLCTALVITFIISPALMLTARHLIPGGNTSVAQGFQIISLVPTLFVSAVLLTRMARGNAAVALYITITSNMLSIVVAPLLIKLTLGTDASSLNLGSTMLSMVFTVLIPTVLGQVARNRWEEWSESHAKMITVVSQFTILLFIVIGVSTLPRSVLSPAVVLAAILGGIVLHSVLLGIGKVAGVMLKSDVPTKRALMFCSAQKSFTFDVLLCEHAFAGNNAAYGLAILPGIVYYLIVLSVDSVIAQFWAAQTARAEECEKMYGGITSKVGTPTESTPTQAT